MYGYGGTFGTPGGYYAGPPSYGVPGYPAQPPVPQSVQTTSVAVEQIPTDLLEKIEAELRKRAQLAQPQGMSDAELRRRGYFVQPPQPPAPAMLTQMYAATPGPAYVASNLAYGGLTSATAAPAPANVFASSKPASSSTIAPAASTATYKSPLERRIAGPGAPYVVPTAPAGAALPKRPVERAPYVMSTLAQAHAVGRPAAPAPAPAPAPAARPAAAAAKPAASTQSSAAAGGSRGGDTTSMPAADWSPGEEWSVTRAKQSPALRWAILKALRELPPGQWMEGPALGPRLAQLLAPCGGPPSVKPRLRPVVEAMGEVETVHRGDGTGKAYSHRLKPQAQGVRMPTPDWSASDEEWSVTRAKQSAPLRWAVTTMLRQLPPGQWLEGPDVGPTLAKLLKAEGAPPLPTVRPRLRPVLEGMDEVETAHRGAGVDKVYSHRLREQAGTDGSTAAAGAGTASGAGVAQLEPVRPRPATAPAAMPTAGRAPAAATTTAAAPSPAPAPSSSSLVPATVSNSVRGFLRTASLVGDGWLTLSSVERLLSEEGVVGHLGATPLLTALASLPFVQVGAAPTGELRFCLLPDAHHAAPAPVEAAPVHHASSDGDSGPARVVAALRRALVPGAWLHHASAVEMIRKSLHGRPVKGGPVPKADAACEAAMVHKELARLAAEDGLEVAHDKPGNSHKYRLPQGQHAQAQQKALVPAPAAPAPAASSSGPGKPYVAPGYTPTPDTLNSAAGSVPAGSPGPSASLASSERFWAEGGVDESVLSAVLRVLAAERGQWVSGYRLLMGAVRELGARAKSVRVPHTRFLEPHLTAREVQVNTKAGAHARFYRLPKQGADEEDKENGEPPSVLSRRRRTADDDEDEGGGDEGEEGAASSPPSAVPFVGDYKTSLARWRKAAARSSSGTSPSLVVLDAMCAALRRSGGKWMSSFLLHKATVASVAARAPGAFVPFAPDVEADLAARGVEARAGARPGAKFREFRLPPGASADAGADASEAAGDHGDDDDASFTESDDSEGDEDSDDEEVSDEEEAGDGAGAGIEAAVDEEEERRAEAEWAVYQAKEEEERDVSEAAPSVAEGAGGGGGARGHSDSSGSMDDELLARLTRVAMEAMGSD